MKQRRNARARQLYKHWVHCVMVSKVVCSFRQRAYSEILARTWRSMWTSTTRVWVSILVESVIMLSYLASMRTWRFLCLRTVLMLCNWKGIKCLTDKHWSDRAACCKMVDWQNIAECTNVYSNDAQCDAWAQNGECDLNPAWMITYCRKSCWKCQNAGK